MSFQTGRDETCCDALRHAPPIKGAVDGLSALSEHEIWLVTSRPISTRDLTLSWLDDNGVHYDQLVFKRRGDKLSAGATFNVFVEDFLDEATTIAKADITRFYLTNLGIKHPNST